MDHVRFDEGRRLVQVGNGHKLLSPALFALFQTLVQAGGRTVEYDALFKVLGYEGWDRHEAKDALRMHMRRLRLVVGYDTVTSVSGHGYRMGDGAIQSCPLCGRVS